jgi:hypothetical protein
VTSGAQRGDFLDALWRPAWNWYHRVLPPHGRHQLDSFFVSFLTQFPAPFLQRDVLPE